MRGTLPAWSVTLRTHDEFKREIRRSEGSLGLSLDSWLDVGGVRGTSIVESWEAFKFERHLPSDGFDAANNVGIEGVRGGCS